MVAIGVVDLATRRVSGEREQRNARPVAEIVDRLDEAGVPVSASLVPRDEHDSLGLQLWIGLECIENLLHIRFEQVDLGRLRMSVEQAVRLAEGDGRQSVVLDVREEVYRILDMCGPLCRIPHDGSGVLEWVADLA